MKFVIIERKTKQGVIYQRERGDTPGRPSFIFVFHMATVTRKKIGVLGHRHMNSIQFTGESERGCFAVICSHCIICYPYLEVSDISIKGF